ncbi:meiotic recombination protein REC114 [Microcaecilia unicolor]|uniref:Meiotic recombination protein REC114 n=1 Tax=Microcaecilia unicolor TaxID=1415580 RepID=A0A6P7X4G0_9AMPH|nr:meiotic recombination protein REC114 [Microcaecilia unicolor]
MAEGEDSCLDSGRTSSALSVPWSKGVHRDENNGFGSSLRPASFEWSLKRYGRFIPKGAARLGSEGDDPASSWKVLESDEKSGLLTLNVVGSGHFFISQGQTLLEGFSLIDAHKWLKIGRLGDCLLFGSKIKNESRMFRVQFNGESKERALECCSNCVQKLELYVSVQVSNGQSHELPEKSYSQTSQENNQGINSQDATGQNRQSQHAANSDEPVPLIAKDGYISVKQILKSVLKTGFELPIAYQYSAWSAEELEPFLRLCLLDKNFPAFVEEVEKKLQKLAED